MRKKEITLKIVSIFTVSLGLVSAVIGLFLKYLTQIDASWFVSRYGPNGLDAYRTYDGLYLMTLRIVELHDKYLLFFYSTLFIGLLVFGITCGLWARDLKRLKK